MNILPFAHTSADDAEKDDALTLRMALKDFRSICSWVNYHWQAEAAGVERGATEHIYMRNGYNYLEGAGS